MPSVEDRISRRLRALRETQGITVSDLGGRTGLSQTQVTRLENGQQGFRFGTVSRIAAVLGVHPVYFFIEDNDPDEPVYGLLGVGDLPRAIRRAPVREVLERVAHAYTTDRDAFLAIGEAVRAITGDLPSW